MQRTCFLAVLTCIVLFAAVSVLGAQTREQPKQTLAAQVKEDTTKKGVMVLEVNGNLDLKEAWLGRSFYPPGCGDAIIDGNHVSVKVRSRTFKETWTIPENCAGGAYGVALWTRKVGKKDCEVKECRYCAVIGYHFEGLLASVEGVCGKATLNAVAELQPDGRAINLKISGELRGTDGWLGVSFYPSNVKNALREGQHTTTRARTGEFAETVPVPEKFIPGVFEVAIWSQKVEKRNCRTENCAYCKQLGYHMEGFLTSAWGEAARPVSGTISAKVAVNQAGNALEITLSGEIIGSNAWLGVSLYPPNCADPLKEGKHYSFFFKEGRVERIVPVPEEFCGGQFEAALWSKKVLKARCPYPDCPYCALLEYHMEGFLKDCSGRLAVGEYE